ncbi:hypothetical protein C8F04DRAFT_1133567, partial [Mycena alexandri]
MGQEKWFSLPLPNALSRTKGWTSDTGWGCMQSLLAVALGRVRGELFLGFVISSTFGLDWTRGGLCARGGSAARPWRFTSARCRCRPHGVSESAARRVLALPYPASTGQSGGGDTSQNGRKGVDSRSFFLSWRSCRAHSVVRSRNFFYFIFRHMRRRTAGLVGDSPFACMSFAPCPHWQLPPFVRRYRCGFLFSFLSGRVGQGGDSAHIVLALCCLCGL